MGRRVRLAAFVVILNVSIRLLAGKRVVAPARRTSLARRMFSDSSSHSLPSLIAHRLSASGPSRPVSLSCRSSSAPHSAGPCRVFFAIVRSALRERSRRPSQASQLAIAINGLSARLAGEP